MLNCHIPVNNVFPSGFIWEFLFSCYNYKTDDKVTVILIHYDLLMLLRYCFKVNLNGHIFDTRTFQFCLL